MVALGMCVNPSISGTMYLELVWDKKCSSSNRGPIIRQSE